MAMLWMPLAPNAMVMPAHPAGATGTGALPFHVADQSGGKISSVAHGWISREVAHEYGTFVYLALDGETEVEVTAVTTVPAGPDDMPATGTLYYVGPVTVFLRRGSPGSRFMRACTGVPDHPSDMGTHSPSLLSDTQSNAESRDGARFVWHIDDNTAT